jgi:hypothetical protein
MGFIYISGSSTRTHADKQRFSGERRSEPAKQPFPNSAFVLYGFSGGLRASHFSRMTLDVVLPEH